MSEIVTSQIIDEIFLQKAAENYCHPNLTKKSSLSKVENLTDSVIQLFNDPKNTK